MHPPSKKTEPGDGFKEEWERREPNVTIRYLPCATMEGAGTLRGGGPMHLQAWSSDQMPKLET